MKVNENIVIEGEEQVVEEQVAEEQVAGEQVAGEQVAEEQDVAEQVKEEQISAEAIQNEESTDEQQSSVQIQSGTETTTKQKSIVDVKSLLNYICIALGCIIIIMGIVTLQKDVSVSTHRSVHSNIGSYSFGADYYTESYNAAYETVNKLNSVDDGLEALNNNAEHLISSIYYGTGMLMIAIGLGTVGVGCCFLKKE